jgi:hypothetical protein
VATAQERMSTWSARGHQVTSGVHCPIRHQPSSGGEGLVMSHRPGAGMYGWHFCFFPSRSLHQPTSFMCGTPTVRQHELLWERRHITPASHRLLAPPQKTNNKNKNKSKKLSREGFPSHEIRSTGMHWIEDAWTD